MFEIRGRKSTAICYASVVEQEEVIRTLKEDGRTREIPAALKEIASRESKAGADVPDDLCWLYGQDFEDYIHDVRICQEFARRSRELMAEKHSMNLQWPTSLLRISSV